MGIRINKNEIQIFTFEKEKMQQRFEEISPTEFKFIDGECFSS